MSTAGPTQGARSAGAAEGTPVSTDARATFGNVQALVLCGSHADHQWAQHLLVDASADDASLQGFLSALLLGTDGERWHVSVEQARTAGNGVQLAIGLSLRGLQRLDVPEPVLSPLYRLAKAFTQGAAARAAGFLNDHGASAAECWDWPRPDQPLHMALTLHGTKPRLDQALAHIGTLANDARVKLRPLPACAWTPPPGKTGQWVHFGYRDGLTGPRIVGWHGTAPGSDAPDALRWHRAGEFVLGHRQDSGANPWHLPDAAAEVRQLYRDASFGVLRQIQQDEAAFRQLLDAVAKGLNPDGDPAALHDYARAKLMGRWPDGHRLESPHQPGGAAPTGPLQEDDNFHHAADEKGEICPFSAHIRRMNPREGGVNLVHSMRRRMLLRRGMPYGPLYQPGEAPAAERGLMGLFFCASLEEQFEHIVGQWGAGIALGSEDPGNAHDPFVSCQPARLRHPAPPEKPKGLDKPQEPPEASRLVVPRPAPAAPVAVSPPDCVRTDGTAYLFYPGAKALDFLASGQPWKELRWDEP